MKHVESQGRSIGENVLIRAIDYKGVYVYGIIYPLRRTRELRRKQQKKQLILQDTSIIKG